MFDIGFSELLLVFIIGLLVLGPERLPKAARTLGYWMGRARSTFNNLRNELEREALNQDMRQQLEKEMRDMGLDKDSLRETLESKDAGKTGTTADEPPPVEQQPDTSLSRAQSSGPESIPSGQTEPEQTNPETAAPEKTRPEKHHDA